MHLRTGPTVLAEQVTGTGDLIKNQQRRMREILAGIGKGFRIRLHDVNHLYNTRATATPKGKKTSDE
jgi:hypothetical protein